MVEVAWLNSFLTVLSPLPLIAYFQTNNYELFYFIVYYFS